MHHSSIPGATYRLQFNEKFRFSDATALIDYFAKLGITDIYASPILTSRRGSQHGYDVTEPTQIDPEIGSAQDFEQFENELLARGMRLILDIVPNHMAASNENRWWMDVLENGGESVFASYFDIDWHPPSRNLEDTVFLPVLGRPFGDVLDRGELRLAFESGKFFVRYFESIFPLMPRSYRRLLKHRVDELKSKLSEDSPAYQEYAGIIAALSSLSEITRSKGDAEKRVRFDSIRERLQRLVTSNGEIAAFIDENIASFNGTPGDPASLCALEHLLGEQHFRLAYWQDPNEGINYRRFFAISDLVGIRAEDPHVFDATHEQIIQLSAKGAIRGLRVDHIDGLRDPAGYLNRLQERLVAAHSPESGHPYILVEKILSRTESLPEDWPVSGTTGYEYLNAANGVFVCPSGARKLEEFYFEFISKEMNFADVMYEKKKLVMNTLLRVEMRSLGRQLADLAAQDRYARSLLRPELMDTLIEVTACFPVYRTYIRNLEVPDSAKQLIERAIDDAKTRPPRLSRADKESGKDAAFDPELFEAMQRNPERQLITRYDKHLSVVVDREKAHFSAWYDVFPRSCAPEPGRHGTFRDCEGRLPCIASMGFDVVYLPPVHPIGHTFRKGKNNSIPARPDDVGSPWAIGSEEGGHTSIHSQLGSIEDFKHFVASANEHGLEVALDIAFQCTPDHPYVKEHREWFRTRPDNTIQYAENPPKQYQDIFPLDFENAEWPALWDELKHIILFWIEQGVRIFRVDNPQTKPFAFWEWLIGEIKQKHPETIFLAEAFTRPAVMYRLAKLGFSQSYTYFTWRNTKQELIDYFETLTQTEVKEFFRPNLWPNTPDILPEFLQVGGRPAFMIRFILAATLGASYGIYGGAFELYENTPYQPGSEEYLNSEK